MNGRNYQVEYDATAQEDLEALPATVRMQILKKIGRLHGGWHGNIKRLHEAEAAYRLRMGDYRVLFDVAGSVIVIRRIGHRKEIYD